MREGSVRYSIVEAGETIAMFQHLRDAREMVSELNWNGRVDLAIVRLK